MKLMANIAGFHAVRTFLLFRISLWRPFYSRAQIVLLTGEYIFDDTSETQPHRYVSSYPPPTNKTNKNKQTIKKKNTSTTTSNNKSRKPHSINEAVVWRDPGESWACLCPVSDFDWIHPSSGCDDTGMGCFVEQVVFLTVYHRGPLPLRELHSTDETQVWRDPGGSWACLRPVSDNE